MSIDTILLDVKVTKCAFRTCKNQIILHHSMLAFSLVSFIICIFIVFMVCLHNIQPHYSIKKNSCAFYVSTLA